MLNTTTITTKGQVTIPIEYRQKLGLRVGQKVQFMVKDEPFEELTIKPIPDFSSLQGVIKTHKKYTKVRARAAITRDLLAGHKL